MAVLGIDVRNKDGVMSRVPLTGQQGQNLVIGRTAEAQIMLDSRTISRRHAEMVCDPFGRWWIRDLGSHNGTLVNGNKVLEHLLKPGDLVQVGEFTLMLASEETVKPSADSSTVQVMVGDEAKTGTSAGRVASLRDFEPPRLSATHLSIVSDFGQQLLALEEPSDRLAALCGLMLKREFRGRSAMALRASKEALTEAPVPLCAPQAAPGHETLSPYISKTLLRTMLARNEPVLASNATMNRPGEAQPAMAELSMAADVMTVAAVACPIKSEQRYTDLLYVLFPPEYGNSEWLALTAMAVKQYQQAESTWAARKLGEEHASIERELKRAEEIQKRLVPKGAGITGVDYAIGFVPCRWVGGDYVDVIMGKDGRVLLAIADVCGKGLPAALVALSLRTMAHTAMRTSTPLVAFMQNLNVYLADTLTEGTFVTMIAAMVDPASGTAELMNCGHPPGFIISPTGGMEFTQQEANLPLGLDAMAELVSVPMTLRPGEYLAMYTDGLSELTLSDGTLLGEEALGVEIARLVKEASAPPTAADLSERLTAFLDGKQSGMAKDDRTFVIARRV